MMNAVIFNIGDHGPFEGRLERGAGVTYTLTFLRLNTGLKSFQGLPTVLVDAGDGPVTFTAGEYFLASAKTGIGISGQITLHVLS
jgi:hypothetical protein